MFYLWLSIILLFSSPSHSLLGCGFASENAAKAFTFSAGFFHRKSLQYAALRSFLVWLVVEYFIINFRFGPWLYFVAPEARVFAVIHLFLLLCLIDGLLDSHDLVIDFHDLFEIVCRLIFLLVQHFEAQICYISLLVQKDGLSFDLLPFLCEVIVVAIVWV